MRATTTLVSMLVLAGCGDAAPAARPEPARPTFRRAWSDDDVQKPAWIADATRGGSVIGAYGSTDHNPHMTHVDRRDLAMASARRELARMVAVKVQAVMKDWVADSGAGSQQFAENISRTIAIQNIRGSAQRDEWIHPKTGELYVWVVVDAQYQERMAKEVAAAAKVAADSAAAKDPALAAHLQAKLAADGAFNELDRLLDAKFQGK